MTKDRWSWEGLTYGYVCTRVCLVLGNYLWTVVVDTRVGSRVDGTTPHPFLHFEWI